MANRPLVGSGPVPFTAPSDSKLYFIPLSSLTISPSGTVDSSEWVTHFVALTEADKTGLTNVLAALVDRGTLRASEGTAPREAIRFEAAKAGELGNHITVDLKKVVPDATDAKDPLKAKVEMEVVERIDFDNASIDVAPTETFVGTMLSAAKSPGLVKFKTSTNPVLYPQAGDYLVTANAIDIKQAGVPGTVAFTLEPMDAVAGMTLKVAVSAADPAQKVFSLVVTRTATTAADTKLAELLGPTPTKTALAHAVLVLAPGGKNEAVAFPAVKRYALAGGSKEVTTTAAKSSATAFTNG